MAYAQSDGLISFTTILFSALHMVMVRYYARHDDVRDEQSELLMSGILCLIQLYVGIILLLNQI